MLVESPIGEQGDGGKTWRGWVENLCKAPRRTLGSGGHWNGDKIETGKGRGRGI